MFIKFWTICYRDISGPVAQLWVLCFPLVVVVYHWANHPVNAARGGGYSTRLDYTALHFRTAYRHKPVLFKCFAWVPVSLWLVLVVVKCDVR